VQVAAFEVGRHAYLTFMVFILGVVPVQVLGKERLLGNHGESTYQAANQYGQSLVKASHIAECHKQVVGRTLENFTVS